MNEFPIKCDCGCDETEKRNVYTENIDGNLVDAEYSLYCKECGTYLGYFSYGHWDY